VLKIEGIRETLCKLLDASRILFEDKEEEYSEPPPLASLERKMRFESQILLIGLGREREEVFLMCCLFFVGHVICLGWLIPWQSLAIYFALNKFFIERAYGG
jgi:hypothetical protein